MVALLSILYMYVLPHRGDSAVKAQTPALSSAPLKPAGGTHPMAKYFELGGIRIQETKNGRARIDFVVVNHSNADLPKMVMDVTLRSADKDFFTFAVNLPSLGPFESKDLQQTVRTELKPYELPDWQLIRPQFSIRSDGTAAE